MTQGGGPSAAVERLQALARRELAGWTGLVRPTTVDDVAAVLEVDRSWAASGRLGRERRAASWLAASGGGYPVGLRVWVADEEVALIDAPDVELPGDLAALLDALGPAEAALTSYLGTLPIERSECVYPRRGLTLYVNPETGRLLRVAVFAPATLDEYERHLRLDLRRVRLPLGRNAMTEELP